MKRLLLFPILLWRRVVHEYHMKRYGWHYTEKPMWGKPLYIMETKWIHFPKRGKPKCIVFKPEEK